MTAQLGPLRVVVVVPAFNEEHSLGAVLDELRCQLPSADVVVVDDGSTDRTGEVAQTRGVGLIRLPFNCGIGVTMQTGYLLARRNNYDVAIQVDGDGQHDPAELERLIAPIVHDTADVVIGSRFLCDGGDKSTAARRAGIAWLAAIISRLSGQRITDPTSGFRAANRAAISAFAADYPNDYPEPEVIVPLCRRGFRISEVPVTMRERQGGKSSITALRSVYYMLKVTLSILVGLFRTTARR